RSVRRRGEMDLTEILKKRRREILMGVALLVVLTIFLYTRAGGGATPGSPEEAVFVTGPPANVAKAMAKISSAKIAAVLLERLSEERIAYDPTQRNIFRYGNLPPSPEELARIEAAKKAAEEAKQAAMQAALDAQKKQAEALEAAKNQPPPPPIDPATGLPFGVDPPPPPKPMPPAITLRYSGYLGSERNK